MSEWRTRGAGVSRPVIADPAQLDQDLKNAQEDLRDSGGDVQRAVAERKLARLETIKAALARYVLLPLWEKVSSRSDDG